MASGKLYFTSTGICDIQIDSDGVVPMVEGNEELVQSLKDELESNMTQWYLGYDWGLKIIQADGSGILDGKKTDDEIQEEIQRVISKYSDITSSSITSITTTNRNVSIEIEIETNFDDTTYSLTISI